MFKRKTKFLAILLIAFLLVSTVCFATEELSAGDLARTIDEPVVTSEVGEDTATTEEEPSVSDLDIKNNDLYLFGTDVVMDQLVDGNVYLFGSNVTISGRVNGNLFVFGNNVTFTEDSYVVQSIYACANRFSYSGQATDLYVASSVCDITANSFILRDLKVGSGSLTFAGGVGRNADIFADTFTFAADSTNSIIYGNLNYASVSEVTIPEGKVEGEVNYTHVSDKTKEVVSTSEMISNYVVSACTFILTSLVFYLLVKAFAPKFVEGSSKFASSKAVLSFVIGLLAIVIIPVATLILFITGIGAILGFILLALYIALLLLGAATVVVTVSKKVVEVRNITNKYMDILLVVLVSLIVWAIELIPYIGGIAGFAICCIGVGIVLQSIFHKKEKTEQKEVVENK